MGGVTWELLPELPQPVLRQPKYKVEEYAKVEPAINFIPDQMPGPLLAKPKEPTTVAITSKPLIQKKHETSKIRAGRKPTK